MSTEWLAIQSFQHGQDLLTAINTLSIYTKLEPTGISDKEQAEAADRARGTIASFLEELEAMVQEIEKREVVLGIDPRRRQLVRNFIAAKHNQRRFHSALFQSTFANVRRLLHPSSKEDRRSLIECLEELRVLLEEHIHTDTMRILGEI